MTRRRTPLSPPPAANPFEAASGAHESELAGKLNNILGSLTEFDNSSIKGIIYKKPTNGVGSFEWIEEAAPPFEFGNMFTELKERFGGGQFELRVLAGGRIRGVLPFNIAREKERAAAPAAVANPQGMTMGEMLTLMMTQQAEARRDAADRAAQQSVLLAGVATAIGPALIGLFNRPQTQVSETVALIAALQDRKGGGGGIKETLEAMAAFKQLMGPPEGEREGGGFDAEDIIGSAGRLAGPVVKGLADYFARMREGQAGGGAPSADEAEPQGGSGALALGAPPPASRYRIINLVRDDVTYGFLRGHDPEKIADLVYDIIAANQVTQAEIDDLAAAFALSPTGLDDLADEGIDLRARPQWAGEFFAALAAIHTEESDDLGGGEGRETDVARNGATLATGDARPARAKPVSKAHN